MRLRTALITFNAMRSRKMKVIIVIITIALSGCVRLSSERSLSIDNDEFELSDSSCGYGSMEWKRFGDGNLASFSSESIDVEFCSIPYYSKIIASGFMIPIIPIDGRLTENERWIQIENTSSEHVITIQSDFSSSQDDLSIIKFCEQRYPNSNCPTIDGLEGGRIELKESDSVWMSVPESEKYIIKLHSGTHVYEFMLIEAKAYSWWMVTV